LGNFVGAGGVPEGIGEVPEKGFGAPIFSFPEDFVSIGIFVGLWIS
jgi:hypothetical protein